MSKDLLLEIGTEEVPAHAMPGILAQLKEKAEKSFAALHLDYKNVRTIGTPRRTALLVEALAERQPDVTTERRGPSLQVAFKDGQPTKAAEGFARGQGLTAADLVQKDGYVYAEIHEAGKPTQEILKTLLPELITGLNFPNSMRWGSLDFRFIRPLRWIVALFDEEIIPFEVATVKSGRVSRGHRFLSEGEFSFVRAADYESALEVQCVIPDQEKRRDIIRKQLVEVAKANGGVAEITEELLEEVIYLVEYPTALCGHFEDKYLELPPEAVITPMRDHQRYFPVKTGDGKLLPLFLTVRNGGSAYLETVQHGNERVLRARLADAQFFFDEDRKKSLEQHRDKLKTVVFQEGLGTVYAKTERLQALAELIADQLGVDAATKEKAMRAALLSKADLVTGMVTEFTELQGIMGREYAKLDGEDAEVAQAIDEHYQPRFAGDSEPASVTGRIVSFADKIDNLVATFSRGLIPTGSQDPFALRRQALGLVNMLVKAGYSISLAKIVDKELNLLQITDADQRAKLQADVADFMRLRLKNVLDEAGIRYDIADAVLADVDDVCAVMQKAQALAQAGEKEMAAVQAFVRAGNLAKKADEAVILPEKLELEVEQNLAAAYECAEGAVNAALTAGDYAKALQALAELAAPIDAFFDGVMVMAEDAEVRRSRLGLLKTLDNLIRRVADFDKLVL